MEKILKILSFLIISGGVIFGCKKAREEEWDSSIANNIIELYSQAGYSCSGIDDTIPYPRPWTKETADTFKISEARLQNTSTCGLIQTFFNQPWNVLGPWCTICSNLSINGIEYFNDRLKNDPVICELLSRDDALNKLIGKYVDLIKNLTDMEINPGCLHSFEILLASESINEFLTETASDDLLILSLKMIEIKKGNNIFNYESSLAITRHIMTNILLKKKYKPFLSACLKNGSLETYIYGYKVCYEGDKVENFAKMYLKNKN